MLGHSRAPRPIPPRAQGTVNFEEFVIAVWNYNTFSRDGLCKFIFELYDLDGSASLDVDEIKRMFTEMCGEEFARTERAVLLLERIELLGTGAIRKDQFVSFVAKNQGVLMPAYHMQRAMQAKMGGADFWKRLSLDREEFLFGAGGPGSDTSFLSLKEVLRERRQDHLDSAARQGTQMAAVSRLQTMQPGKAKYGGSALAVARSQQVASASHTRTRPRAVDPRAVGGAKGGFNPIAMRGAEPRRRRRGGAARVLRAAAGAQVRRARAHGRDGAHGRRHALRPGRDREGARPRDGRRAARQGLRRVPRRRGSTARGGSTGGLRARQQGPSASRSRRSSCCSTR